ncbi:MAG TPA: lipoyl(octanoyl) transferase LipB [Terriglobia bacterium]|nr:lipoyl(octanoyl) transferase LipB [Terriglobia bacterium]
MTCIVEQLGLVDYAEGLQFQREKVAARKAKAIPDTLLLLEHPHVYTLGRNAKREHLLISEQKLAALGAKVHETDRGGDITYHGPGQLVGYPIVDLAEHRRDVAWFMRSLEEVFIRVASDFGTAAGRMPGAAGVWVGNDKLVAMGVHISRWVTSHGFAFNVNTDLSYFQWIVPCGLRDRGVTSLAKLLGRHVEMETVARCVIGRFGEVFGMQMAEAAELNAGKAEPRTEHRAPAVHF